MGVTIGKSPIDYAPFRYVEKTELEAHPVETVVNIKWFVITRSWNVVWLLKRLNRSLLLMKTSAILLKQVLSIQRICLFLVL